MNDDSIYEINDYVITIRKPGIAIFEAEEADLSKYARSIIYDSNIINSSDASNGKFLAGASCSPHSISRGYFCFYLHLQFNSEITMSVSYMPQIDSKSEKTDIRSAYNFLIDENKSVCLSNNYVLDSKDAESKKWTRVEYDKFTLPRGRHSFRVSVAKDAKLDAPNIDYIEFNVEEIQEGQVDSKSVPENDFHTAVQYAYIGDEVGSIAAYGRGVVELSRPNPIILDFTKDIKNKNFSTNMNYKTSLNHSSSSNRESTLNDNSGSNRESALNDNSGSNRESALNDNSSSNRESALNDNSVSNRESALNDNSVSNRDSVLNCDSKSALFAVEYSESSDFANSIVVDNLKSPQLEVYNLKLGQDVYWRVLCNNEVISSVHYLKVASDCPRNLFIEGVTNVRDVGGYKSSLAEEGIIRQGLYLRGANLDSITEKGKKELLRLGVRVEIDMRDDYMCKGPYVDGIEYFDVSIPSRTEPIRFEQFGKEYKTIFELIANADVKPIYLHCSVGADRTGIATFILLVVCGVSYEDAARDYLFTNFSTCGARYLESEFIPWWNKLDTFEGETKAEKAKKWLLSKGVDEEKVEKIRKIFIRGYK